MEPDSPVSDTPRQDANDARQDSNDARQHDSDTSNAALQGMVESLADTVDKLSSNVDRMIEASEKTRSSMEGLSLSNKTLASKNRQKVGVIGTLVLLVIAAGVFGWRIEAQGSCISSWANASTSRTTALTGASSKRSQALRKVVDAEHEALVYALTHPNGTPAEAAHEVALLTTWGDRTSDFQTADSNYVDAVASNKVPASPKFICQPF